MMKRIAALALALMLLLASTALAEDTLYGTAALAGDTLFYSGSVDGAALATYAMDLNGENVRVLYERDLNILAAHNNCLLGLDYGAEEPRLLILLPDGSTVTVDEVSYSNVVRDGDVYYLGAFCVNYDGTGYRSLLDVQENRAYYYDAAAVSDGYYYYHDMSEYGDTVFYEGTTGPLGAALMRLNLTTGAIEEVAGLGSRYLGEDDAYIYYTMESFLYWSEDDAQEYQVEDGLYRADKATLTASKLVGLPEDGSHLTYNLLQDGVIYGARFLYNEERSDFVLTRTSTDGADLGDIPVDNIYSDIQLVANGKLYVTQSHGSMEGDTYVTNDLIVAIDLATMTAAPINDGLGDIIYYSEGAPTFLVAGDSILYCSYDYDRDSLSLRSCKLDGSDRKVLATGYSWAQG